MRRARRRVRRGQRHDLLHRDRPRLHHGLPGDHDDDGRRANFAGADIRADRLRAGLAQMDALGFGRRPHDVDSATFTTVAPTWACAVYQLADATGVELSRTSLDADFYISPDRSTALSGMVVEAGTIGALRWTLTGFVGDEPRFVINHINRMGAGMAPDWPKMDGHEGGYRIEIDGFPPY